MCSPYPRTTGAWIWLHGRWIHRSNAGGIAARAHRHPPATSRDQRPSRRSSAFRRADASRALVPAFVTQPLLEASQAHLRIASAKSVDVGLEPRGIEPAEHLVELLAEDEAHDRQRQALERDLLAKHAAENLGCLEIGKLAAGDLERFADELLWALESERDEGSDIVGGDRLIRLVASDRIPEPAFQESDLHLIDVVVLHEGRRPQHGRRQAEFADVLLDLPLAVPVINPGIAVGAADGAVDEMGHACLLCSIGKVLALPHFAQRADGPEI